MSVSPAASSIGSEDLRGFTKRASRIVSNAALFDLVQDMAQKLDTELPEINRKLDLLLERVDGA